MPHRWYSIPDPDDLDKRISLPSVTTILDVTMPHQKRLNLTRSVMDNPITATLKREAGANRGTEFDGWVKSCCHRRMILPYPSGLEKLCAQFRPYLANLVRHPPHFTDELVYSIDLGYAGTVDLVSWHPQLEGFCLYEIKTSAYRPWASAVSEAEIQAAAYYLAWPEHRAEPLQGICTVHVTPYEFLENLIPNGDRLAKLLLAWGTRLKQFGSRFSEANP